MVNAEERWEMTVGPPSDQCKLWHGSARLTGNNILYPDQLGMRHHLASSMVIVFIRQSQKLKISVFSIA